MVKIITITGIRPDFIRMSQIFKKFDENFNHILVHSGQHYDKMLSDVFFEELQIRKPDYNLDIGGPGKEHFHQAADLSVKIIDLIRKENLNPDLIVFLGDSNSVVCSVPLKKEGYKIAHIEAGMRSYDRRMLEETNRVVCDHCSEYLFVYHNNYKEKAIKENIDPNRIFVVGNTIVEVAQEMQKELYGTPKGYNHIILDVHRPENFKDRTRLENIIKFANDMNFLLASPVKMLNFGRTEQMLKEYKINLEEIELVPLMSFKNYIHAVYNSVCLISDCLHPDSNIMLENGIITKIKNIKCGNKIISNNTYENVEIFEEKKIEKKYKIKSVFNEIRCSEKHKLFVKGSNNEIIEKEARNITIKDKLACFCHIKAKGEIIQLKRINQPYYVNINENGINLLKEKSINDSLNKFGRFKCNTIRLKKGVSINRLLPVLSHLDIDHNEFISKNTFINKKHSPRQHNIYQPSYLSLELSEIIGYLCGDGYVDQFHINFYDENIQNLNYINNRIKCLFNINGKIKTDKRHNGLSLTFSSKSLVDFFKINFQIECESTISKKKGISNIIMKSNNDVVSGYIRGLFEAEGYVTDHQIGISMSDKDVIEKIKLLLLRFGIVSNYYELQPRKSVDKSIMYRLLISENNSRYLFKEKIGFISDHKNEKLNNMLTKCNKKIKKPIKRLDNMFFDRIQKIEEIDDNEKYIDIHVKPNNTFMVNGVLSHNSGTAQEEPALFGIPVIVPRDFTERPESVEYGCSYMLDVNSQYNATWGEAYNYVNAILNGSAKIDPSWLGDGNTSQIIVDKIRELYDE